MKVREVMCALLSFAANSHRSRRDTEWYQGPHKNEPGQLLVHDLSRYHEGAQVAHKLPNVQTDEGQELYRTLFQSIYYLLSTSESPPDRKG